MPGSMWSFPERENLTGDVVIEILSFWQKNHSTIHKMIYARRKETIHKDITTYRYVEWGTLSNKEHELRVWQEIVNLANVKFCCILKQHVVKAYRAFTTYSLSLFHLTANQLILREKSIDDKLISQMRTNKITPATD